jgi:hypothetical protein
LKWASRRAIERAGAGKTPISFNRLGIMKARLAVIVAASLGLLLAGAPTLAQQTENTTNSASNVLVGDPQLRNFSLEGNVTRPAPAPAPQPQAQQQQRPTTRTTTPAQTAQRPTPTQATPGQTSQAPARRETATAPPSIELPTLPPQESLTDQTAVPADALAPPPEQSPAPAAAASSMSLPALLPILPWIVAALALAAALAWFFLRQKPRESYGTAAGSIDLFDAPAPPAAEPQAAPPPPIPAQPKAAPPTGVVSTRLRPWIELQVEPGRAIIDEKKAAVEFHVTVFNSGSVSARDVIVEASLFNAGPHQDQQIQSFFDRPLGEGEPIESIPAMKRLTIRSAVVLPRDQVHPIEFEGRQLFVPLIAFNALYSWAGGRGQTSASYLIGKQTNAEKLAPLRLDLGPRLFRNLAAREHELRLRK